MMKHILLTFGLVFCCTNAWTTFVPTRGLSQDGLTVGFSPLSPGCKKHDFRCKSSSTLSMSSSGSGGSRKKRRRRRKDTVAPPPAAKEEPKASAPPPASVEAEQPKEIKAPETTPPPPVELKPRQDAPVEMEIMDIRKVVSGEDPPPPAPEPPLQKVQQQIDDDDEEEEEDDDDDDEYEYYYVDDDGNEVEVPAESLNSLEQLLIDAQQMEEEEKERALQDKGESDEEKEFSIPKTVGSVLSTIVTVDFFIVCALLLWFLAGIFGSYVLKNDAIQIAFNGIFQPVVQPALGILMIGSAAGAIFKDEEEDENVY